MKNYRKLILSLLLIVVIGAASMTFIFSEDSKEDDKKVSSVSSSVINESNEVTSITSNEEETREESIETSQSESEQNTTQSNDNPGISLDLNSNEDGFTPEKDQAIETIDFETYPLKTSLPSVATTLQGYDYSQSSGLAYFDPFRDGDNLYVSFSNLPEISDDFFYEGWLVDTNAGEFITTGKVSQNIDNVFVDTYEGANLEKYNRYVLTLEPNDNDPAPAEHVVEDNFKEI